jgi:hypothetical protein
MTALWVAYTLTFVHAIIIIGIPSALWPLEYVVVNQLVFELVLDTLGWWATPVFSASLNAASLERF